MHHRGTDSRMKNWGKWSSKQNVLLNTAACMSVLVLVANVVAGIVIRTKYKSQNSVVSLYKGDCRYVQNLDTAIHVIINVLTSLLLAASNLCMQILTAPTRQEVDKAHAEERWLDLGVQSWRNVKSVGWIRTSVWACLGLSSLPLHFM
jgi:hypothetical protein